MIGSLSVSAQLPCKGKTHKTAPRSSARWQVKRWHDRLTGFAPESCRHEAFRQNLLHTISNLENIATHVDPPLARGWRWGFGLEFSLKGKYLRLRHVRSSNSTFFEMDTSGSTASISVVVPTYNRARYLDECLQSLIHQSVSPAQIIVIDDGSTDDTPSVVKRYAPAVTYLAKENGGKARALNFAMPMITGDYVWFFDDDDVALRESIELRLNVLNAHPELSFVYTGHYLGSDDPNQRIRRGKRYTPASPDSGLLLRHLMLGCYFTLQSVMLRRGALTKLGAFDESLAAGEDYDFLLRLAMAAKGIGIPEPTFVFRRHEGVRGSQALSYQAKDRGRFFCKYEQLIGRKLRHAAPLGDYLVPRRPVKRGSADYAEALIHRMTVMASKGLIEEMFDDLTEALSLWPLDVVNRGRLFAGCERAVHTGYATDVLFDDRRVFLRRVGALRNVPGGRRSIMWMARGLFRLAKSYPGTFTVRVNRLQLSARTLWEAVAL